MTWIVVSVVFSVVTIINVILVYTVEPHYFRHLWSDQLTNGDIICRSQMIGVLQKIPHQSDHLTNQDSFSSGWNLNRDVHWVKHEWSFNLCIPSPTSVNQYLTIRIFTFWKHQLWLNLLFWVSLHQVVIIIMNFCYYRVYLRLAMCYCVVLRDYRKAQKDRLTCVELSLTSTLNYSSWGKVGNWRRQAVWFWEISVISQVMKMNTLNFLMTAIGIQLVLSIYERLLVYTKCNIIHPFYLY